MKFNRRQRKVAKRIHELKAEASTSGDIQFDATGDLTFAAAEGEENKNKPFEMTAYSGGKLFVNGFPHPVVIDLKAVVVKGSQGSPNKSLPVTLDHKRNQRVGHVDRVQITANKILMAGSTSANTPHRDEVLDSARDGYPWQASIEGRVQNPRVIRAGQKVTVNGRTFDGPVVVARRFVLRAVSFVSTGGDEDNSVSLAAENVGELDMNFAAWLKSKGIDESTQDDAVLGLLKAQYEGELAASTGEPPPEENAEEKDGGEEAPAEGETAASVKEQLVAEMRKTALAETNRINKIKSLCGDNSELFASALENDWDATKTELEVLKAEREQAPASFAGGIHSRDGAADSDYQDAVVVAMCRDLNIPEEMLLASYGEKAMERASDPQMRGYGLQRLMYETARNAGKHIAAGAKGDDVWKECLVADRDLQANEGFSTLTTTGVLSNIANKALLAAYNATAMIATQVCGIRSVADFKEMTMYRISLGKDADSGLLEKLGPDGEIKHTVLSETEFKLQIGTYARMLALTRHHIINDDLNAFTEAVSQFGRMSARTVDYVFHDVLLTNANNFFGVGNNNYKAGADTALEISSLTDAEKMFLDLSDDIGLPMMLNPQGMLVTSANKVNAESIYNQTIVNETTTTGKKSPRDNPHAGKYPPLTSPWLNRTTLFANATEPQWYLYANPAEVPFMLLGYLRGARTPTLQSSETDFNTLGMQWRAYLDFGVQHHDPKAAVMMKGEA